MSLRQSRGIGNLRTQDETNPAAGDGIHIIAVPAGMIWRLQSFHFHLQTSADAANRSALVSFQDAAGNPFGPTAPGVIQTAALTYSYIGMSGGGVVGVLDAGVAVPVHYAMPFPADFWLPSGAAIIVLVTNIDNTDELKDMTFLIEEIPA